MSLPQYPEYRDSGIEWLGRIPTDWSITRLKYPFDVRLSNVDKHAVDTEPSVLLCNYVDVYKNDRINSRIPFMAATASTAQIERLSLEVGDVLITKDSEDPRDIGVSALVDEVVPNLVCGYHLALLRSRKEAVGAYLQYLLNSDYVAAIFETEATGVTRYALGKYSIENLAIPLPASTEQMAIASFLDCETAKIDALVSEQERLIELLKEKRQAVISHTVTKGLNPDVPMKPSGAKWLGNVPAHWNVTAIKRYCTKITDGAHVSPEIDEGLYPFVSTKDVLSEEIDFDNCLRTSASSFDYMVRTGCQPLVGDVLFSKDGTIGRTAVVREESSFAVASSLIIIRPKRSALSALFLHRLCQSNAISKQVESFVKGAGLPRLSIQNLHKVIGCFPPLEEQTSIAKFLDFETAKLDALIAEGTQAIDLLNERRSALISAAVTGQIDVRGLAAPVAA